MARVRVKVMVTCMVKIWIWMRGKVMGFGLDLEGGTSPVGWSANDRQ